MLSVVIEVLAEAVFVAIMISQILWPIIRGTPLFPILRRERRLRREIAEARQREVEAHLESTLNDRNREKEGHS